MQIKLEELQYQQTAIQSVIDVFASTVSNTFDNATAEGIRSNFCSLEDREFIENIKNVASENEIEEEILSLSDDRELTIEMETGTGKTLVYLKTIYQFYQKYGFTKFIILVPSVAIRQGVLNTLKTFSAQLEDIFGFTPDSFEYSSRKLSKVTTFIESQHPQIMVMTLASFNSEDKILNQAKREDLFSDMPFIDAIGKTRPIIVMDEPQEGMDTENSVKQIAKLNPLVKLRYSATHKVAKNKIYRLTPYDSYKEGLVKKIEVLTVTEKNDEATLKLELSETQNGKGDPKAKIKAWVQSKSGKIEFKDTKWLKKGDNLGEITNNPSYLKYGISQITKSLRTGKWSVIFSNGVEIFEKQTAGSIESIWSLQIEWLLHRHFKKKAKLREQNIKCLSLIFIDRVANYVSDNPIIKDIFVQKYKEIYAEWNNGDAPNAQHIEEIQGYYFAQTGKGEFTDNENSMRKNKDVFDAILKDKVGLLNYGEETANKIEFIFSHSALGVGWDNPNIFNIATLSNSYSEIKKRQEIGRGLRICVNTYGQRVYDSPTVSDEERINELTVIPNETYETFVTQYQTEIKEAYGNTDAGAGMTHTHKGKAQNQVKFSKNKDETIQQAFRRFWKALAKKTNYSVAFEENLLIEKCQKELNKIKIEDFVVEVSSHKIEDLQEDKRSDSFGGKETYAQKAHFTALDLIEELSENTGLSYNTVFKIIEKLKLESISKNPPKFIHLAAERIRQIENEEMLRGLDYHLTDEVFPFDFEDYVKNVPKGNVIGTPKRGVFDKIQIDAGSSPERDFAKHADYDPEVVCFLKLPSYYKIETPIGTYNPDFGMVMKQKQLRDGTETEYYFVIETKGTNDINDLKALRPAEIYKIKCAVKHFAAIGVEVQYEAPIKDYQVFKKRAKANISHSKSNT